MKNDLLKKLLNPKAGLIGMVLLVLFVSITFNVPPVNTAMAATAPSAAYSATAGTGGVTKGLIVKLSAARTIVTATASTDSSIGICEQTADADGLTRYAPAGTQSTVTSGGVIAVGDELTTNSAGKAIVASGTCRTIGIALTAAAAADADVTIQVASATTNASIAATASTGGVTAGLIVKLSAADTVVLASAAADLLVGIAEVTAADTVATRYAGAGRTTTVTSGAAIAVGALLTSDAAGKAITASTGERVVAISLTAAGAADVAVTAIVVPSLH